MSVCCCLCQNRFLCSFVFLKRDIFNPLLPPDVKCGHGSLQQAKGHVCTCRCLWLQAQYPKATVLSFKVWFLGTLFEILVNHSVQGTFFDQTNGYLMVLPILGESRKYLLHYFYVFVRSFFFFLFATFIVQPARNSNRKQRPSFGVGIRTTKACYMQVETCRWLQNFGK